MKINNDTLFWLSNNGLATLDYSVVSPKFGYKLYKFRRDCVKAYKDALEQIQELIKGILTEEELATKTKYEEESKTDNEEYRTLIKKINESEVLKSFLLEEVDVKPCDIPFEEYFKLKEKNKFLQSPVMDEFMEGIIWKEEEV